MNEPTWFRKYRNSGDRFARAVDAAPSAEAEREFSEELELVSALRGLADEPVLDTAARSRIFDSIQAGLREEETTNRKTVAPRPGRGMLVAAAAAAGIIGVGVFGVQLAQNALPGDLLYDVKRTTESIALDLTFEPGERALKHLELASERVNELEALAARHADGDFAESDVYQRVLADLDSEASAASRNVTMVATQDGGGLLPTLRDWADNNAARMNAIKAAMPGDVLIRFEDSVNLLEQIERRADSLAGRLDCYRITSGAVDSLGEVPAQGACDVSGRTESTAVRPSANSKDTKSGSVAAPKPDLTVIPPAASDVTEPAPGEPTDPAGVPAAEVPPVDDVDTDDPAPTLTIPTLVPPPPSQLSGINGNKLTP